MREVAVLVGVVVLAQEQRPAGQKALLHLLRRAEENQNLRRGPQTLRQRNSLG